MSGATPPPPTSLSPATATTAMVSEKTARSKTPSSPSSSVDVPAQQSPAAAASHSGHGGINSGSGGQKREFSSPDPSAAGSNPPLSGQSSAQQFCLRWNNYQSNLTSVFDQLLQNETFVDVTLACDGQSIKAHKMVLSACSPYFQALFFENPCQHPIIIMRDVKWPELKAVVEFMYKGEINVSQDQIGPLLRVAEMLKIRGLADVNGEPDKVADGKTKPAPPLAAGSPENPAKKARGMPRDWEMSGAYGSGNDAVAKTRKRRWPSSEQCTTSSGSPQGGGMPGVIGPEAALTPDPHLENTSPLASMNVSQVQSHPQNPTPNPMSSFSIPTTLETMGLPTLGMSHADDMEIKPGIAEMIREEERAKLMENSHAWLGASTSSIADSYQYQLQSMWQKCWNTNQNLMHHLRFRERGPLKSWRPETMAEAIFSVLKEGLSLSQAARKYDIPYPTFVLYANRVHNMLGPSIDGGTDLRPKGRGRPQRILLGIWPDDHIKGVIKTVVFRDAKDIKDEGMHLSYGRQSPVFPFQEGQINYSGATCANGLPQQTTGASSDPMTPEATAAAVAAVAHGIRQQMQMVAAAQHHPDSQAATIFNMPPHMHPNNAGVAIPKQNSPASNSQRHTSPSISGLSNSSSIGISSMSGLHSIPGLGSNPSVQTSVVTNPSYTPNVSSQQHCSLNTGTLLGSTNISRNNSPNEAAHDLRINSPDESPLNSPLGIALEPAVNLAVGVSGMTYKPSRGYASPRPEHLFQEDISELVGRTSRASNINNFKEPSSNIKVEPVAECRSE